MLETFFSRTSPPILVKLGTNNSWVKGIQIYLNKGSGPFQREDRHKNPTIAC
jgi:hypothetical protein